jgi:hypothetical protein
LTQRLPLAGSSFEARIEPATASGLSGDFLVTVENNGRESAAFELECEDVEGRCAFEVAPLEEIAPGRSATAAVRATVRRTPMGSPETFDFTVRVWPRGSRDEGADRALSARFVHRPPLGWRWPILAGYFGGLVLVAFLAIRFLASPAESAASWAGCRVHYGSECVSTSEAIAASSTPIALGTQSTATPGTSTSTPTATDTPTPSPTPTTEAGLLACENSPNQSSRISGLAPGVTAFADNRSFIRDAPSLDGSRIAQVDLEDQGTAAGLTALATNAFSLTDGPVCSDELVWWRVRVGGDAGVGSLDGWIAELDSEGIVNLHPDLGAVGRPLAR